MSLAGEADVTTTALRDAFTAEVAEGKPGLLLVDMTALAFMDSAAMQMITAAHRVFRHEGGTLALASPGPAVARALKLAGISDVAQAALAGWHLRGDLAGGLPRHPEAISPDT